jgi:hypothetical protein
VEGIKCQTKTEQDLKGKGLLQEERKENVKEQHLALEVKEWAEVEDKVVGEEWGEELTKSKLYIIYLFT